MNHALNERNKAPAAKASIYKFHIKTNIFVIVLAVFAAVAVMQAIELNKMLFETKVIGRDIDGIRLGQEILLEQYSFYGSNMSYYLDD